MSKWDSMHYGSSSNAEIQDIKTIQTAGPTLSILTTNEVKNYLKLSSDTTDNDLVEQLTKAATAIVERECGGLAICQQTWEQKQQGNCKTIKLMRQPIIGTPSVSYYEDFTDTTATNITYSEYFRIVGNELYHLDDYWERGRDGDGYTITYNAGMFTADNYTDSTDQRLQTMKSIICRIVAYLYENREEYAKSISEGTWKVDYSGELPNGIKILIMPFHTGEGLI
jgi:uncharacterized phiE125 gp8 family phage protein